MRKSSALLLAILLLSCCSLRADLPPTNTKTLQLQSSVDDFIWDATRSRFFASSGTSVLVINPETASVEDTLAVGEIAEHIALSGDGLFLYAAVSARGVIKRYRVRDHALDLEISLGRDSNGQYRKPAAMVVMPGQPQSVLVAFPFEGPNMVVYDGTTPRPGTLSLDVRSLYVRPSDNSIYAAGNNRIFLLAVDSQGITIARPMPVPFAASAALSWSGNFATDFDGDVFDLNAGVVSGRAGFPRGTTYHYPVIPDPSGQSLVVAQGDSNRASLVQYSLTTFRAVASSALTWEQRSELGVGDFTVVSKTWGSDGIAVCNSTHGSGPSFVVFLHLSDMMPIAEPEPPKPTLDDSGVIHVPLPANGLTFDEGRNLLWATIPGYVGRFGNSVVSIDPATGNVVDVIDAGSEPGAAVLSGDGSHLFAALGGAPAVSTFDLDTKQAGQRISTIDGTGTNPEYLTPASLAAIPNQGNSVAVLRAWGMFGHTLNAIRSLVIYDGGVPRKQAYAGAVDAIYPGDTDDSFYGALLQLEYADGSHDVYRLRFDSQGVTEDKKLNPLFLGSSGSLVYAGGRLFTGQVQVWTPDAGQLNGALGAMGIPIPFPEQNAVAIVQASAVTTFDLATLRPLASFSFAPGGARAAARIGDKVIAVATGSEILLIPFAAMTSWPSPTGQMHTVATGVRSLDISVNAITALPGSSKLVLALPSSAGSIGNSVAILNPDTGQIETSGFIGSEPAILRTALDGSAAYAYLAGEHRIGRFSIASASRDLLFAPDPAGGSAQYEVVDMALGPDGALTTSLDGGWLATFDNGVVRPNVDKNTQGPGAYSQAPYQIALNPSGTIVYAYQDYWSIPDFKRDALTPNGLQWLSGTVSLIVGPRSQSAQGLLYTPYGDVVDPERSRRLGYFAVSNPNSQVAPDPAAGRVYFISGDQLTIFDSGTYALLASWRVPNSYRMEPMDLVRFGSDGLAFHTSDGHLYLVQISAIPLLAAPIPSPQPSLPVTPGVTVVDLATQDIAYDASRNVIYGTVPNSEAAMGDRIVAIDPGSGAITASWPTGTNPNVLALSDDQSHLDFSSGAERLWFFSGFSRNSEMIRDLDLTTGTMGPGFPVYDPSPDSSYNILDLAVLPGRAKSVAAIDGWSQSVGSGVGSATNSLNVYDDGSPREKYLRRHSFSCGYMVAGASASRLYCSYGAEISRLAVDDHGVTLMDSFPLLPGRGSFGHMVFRDGRIYTTTGLVVDAEAGHVITRLKTQGPVAIDGTLVYWLDPSTSTPGHSNVTLRAFDVSTWQPVSTKQINVTATDVSRLVPCGQGRVAFRAGHEIYIVNP